MLAVLWMVVCALLNRIRGGMFGDKIRAIIPFWATTVARLSTTGLMLIPTLFTCPCWRCLLAWPTLYAGYIFGWKPWQSMDNLPKDIGSLGLRGLVLTVPAGMLLGNISFALAGACMGLLYAVGKYLPALTELDGTEKMSNLNWGEYLFGALLGLALVS